MSLNNDQLRLMTLVNKLITDYVDVPPPQPERVRQALTVLALVCSDVLHATGKDQDAMDCFTETFHRRLAKYVALSDI